MIFKLNCSKYFFSDEEKAEYEKLGFKFERSKTWDHLWKEKRSWTKIGDNLPTIIVHDLEALKQWAKVSNIKSEIIIDFENMEIEIYDDYRE